MQNFATVPVNEVKSLSPGVLHTVSEITPLAET
jgi:hypothetical protein